MAQKKRQQGLRKAPLSNTEITGLFGQFFKQYTSYATTKLCHPCDSTDDSIACHTLVEMGFVVSALRNKSPKQAHSIILLESYRRNSPLLETLTAEPAFKRLATMKQPVAALEAGGAA